MKLFDVDIDVPPSVDKKMFGTPAMIYNEKTNRILAHPSGVYLEDVPIDPVTGNCAFDYNYGDDKGFLKIDILHNNVYENFDSKNELLEFLNVEPDWNLLKSREFVEKLPHIANHYDLVRKISPKSIEELSDVLALIRPGKIKFIEDYLKDKEKVRKNLYRKPKEGYYLKKSHAVAYAVMIVCMMNKLNITKSLFY